MFVRPATRTILLALLACLLVVLADPGVAAAAQFTVDSVVDERDEDLSDGICKAMVFEGTCTLRAAIEEVNEQGDTASTIKFDPTVFNGEESGVIFVAALLGALPAIEVPTNIEAGSNCPADGVEGAPCAGLIGLPGEPVLAVKANDTKISGLSITSGSVLIDVYEERTGFEATGNWIGIGLNGSNALPASAAGILLEHGSDEATIGGSAIEDRNVIAFNGVGLEIQGASETTVRGNFFGVKGDGKTPGPQEVDIRITNFEPTPGTEVKAEDNEIGAVLSENAQKSAECDGGCNVISGAQEGVVLYGANPLDVPASGPTTIHGNYIGLDYVGNEAVNVEGLGGFEGNRFTGISAGSADQVTVGGDPESEANYIVGGSNGVSTEDSDGFEARGNAFGYTPGGAGAAAPTTSAVFAFMAGAGSAVIADNRIRMEAGGTGIKHFHNGATITGNTIKGGEVGINSTETGTPAGSLIEDNVIEDTDDNGIFLGNPGNKVFGNEIVRAGGSGIELEAATDAVKGNVIGGDSSLAENAIFDSDGWAVLIRGTEGSRNEIRRNHGSGNEGDGPFIVFRTVDVVPNEKDPNGIKRPTISMAGKTAASGKGVPGALVRVFFKASKEEGELGGFLGEGEVDVNGDWKVTYPGVPGETLVTATQTKTGGTSELAETAKTPVDPPPATCATDPSLCPPAIGGAGSTPPVVSPTPTPKPKPLKCKKGFVKKKIKGKPKCVKVKKKHKGKGGTGGKRPAVAADLFSF
ncbi:MAG TPA: NosD domain-containing protein [Solirubrobacterales bacterium]|nr:NosD domain-containing protein [Solirubrobacterales bacterium]